MIPVPSQMRRWLAEFGQEHVIAGWDRLTDEQRSGLIEQLKGVDLEQIRQLFSLRDATNTFHGRDKIQPIDVVRLDAATGTARDAGEAALRAGQVAVLMVAGGQGTRLGFDHPKGMYQIGPVAQKSLFQIHTEKVLALRRRYGVAIPFLVMTSPINHVETRDFFAQHQFFGMPADEMVFFNQGTMPAIDMHSGKLLLESPGRLFTSPNGHGGSLTALAEHGLIDRLRDRGITLVFYFQVDNPLVKIGDPLFLGYHCQARSEASTKVVAKLSADDKMGNLVNINGRCAIIEYSDMPKELSQARNPDGSLRFWVGSPAIHVFDLDFLARVTQGKDRIPFHIARKKVPHIDETGKEVKPTKENALKFEMFIFDVLPRAERWAVVETSRKEEFEPLKNATGPDSPETVRQAMSNLAANWLTSAGVSVPLKSDGQAAVPIEVSPLYALDAAELASKVDRSRKIEGPTYLE